MSTPHLPSAAGPRHSGAWLVGLALLVFLIGGGPLRGANGIIWEGTTFPAVGYAGANIAFTATVTNSGDTTWDSTFYLELKDASGNHLYYPSVAGTPPGGTIVATFYMSMPFNSGSYTYGLSAVQHNVDYFGGTQWCTVNVTMQAPPPTTPALSVVWLSSYGFLNVAAPTIDTNWTPSNSYNLRAKFPNPANPLGWHAANGPNNKGVQLDSLPPPGTYYPVTLYWLRNNDAGVLQEVGPGTNRTVTVADPAVLLSSYWFNQNARPTVTINQNLPANYKIVVRVINLATQAVVANLATSWNNDTRYLDHLPGPGTYDIEVFWQKYNTDGTIIAGAPRTLSITVVDGPNRIFDAQGEITGEPTVDEEGNEGTSYSQDEHIIYVPTAGQLRLSGGIDSSDPYISHSLWFELIDPSDNTVISDSSLRTFDVPTSVQAGVYRLRIGTYGDNRYYVGAALTPSSPPPVVTNAASEPLPAGTVGVAYPANIKIATDTWTTAYYAGGLPLGLACDSATGQIYGTPTQAGTFDVYLHAANASGHGPDKKVTLTVNAPPGKPTDLSAYTISATEIRLFWVAPAGDPPAARYEVEVNNVSRGTTTATSMALTGLTPATIYNSKVRAISAAGLTGQWSNDALAGTASTGTPGGAASVWMQMPGVLRDPVDNHVISTRYFDGIVDEILPMGAGGIASFKWVDYTPSYTITAYGYDDGLALNDFWSWANSFAAGDVSPISSPRFELPTLYVNLSGLTARLEATFDVKEGESYQVFEDTTGSEVLNPANLDRVGEEFPSQSTGSHTILSTTYDLFGAMHPKFYVVRYGVAPKTVTASLGAGAVLSTTVSGGGITLDLPNDLKAVIGPDSVTVSSANGGPWIKASPVGVAVGGLPVGDATVGVGSNGGSVELGNGVKVSVTNGVVSVTGLAGVTTLPPGTSQTLGDGTVIAADAQGNTTTTFPGGTVVRVGANGGGSVTLANGATVVVDKNGTVGAGLRLPDGTELVVDSAGRASATLPSGLGVSVGAGGKINLKLPASVPPVIAKVISIGNKILTGEPVWVMRDIFGTGGILPLPAGATSVLGQADISLAAAAGLYEIGLRLGSDNSSIMWLYTVTPSIKLMVDANRDGTIADGETSTAAAPYRFWLNDDIDREVTYTNVEQATNMGANEHVVGFIGSHISSFGVYETEEDDLSTARAQSSGWKLRDWENNRVYAKRDLEDLARLWISTPGLVAALHPKDQTDQAPADLYLGLHWADVTGSPAIKIYPHVETDGGTKYLSNPTVAGNQVTFDYAMKDYRDTATPDITTWNVVAGTDVLVIPPRHFRYTSDSQPNAYFLFEGVSAGKGRLKLVILRKDGANFTPIGDGGSVWLDLKKPHELIERWTAGDDALGVVQPVVRADSTRSGIFAPPATDEEKDYVLYVHGYNMQEFEKQRWIETTHKRLWHLGYKGRVGGFTWPCSQLAPPYDESEERAWQSAQQLKNLLSSLKIAGYRVHMIAHSQGNVVAGEALRLAGANSGVVRTYVASQASIQADCYNTNNLQIQDWGSSDSGTPNVYLSYPGAGGPYLGTSIMQGAATKFANFYNLSDYALTGNSIAFPVHPGWEADQRLKPNGSLWVFSYSFAYTSGIGFQKFENGGWQTLQLPDDRYRIFSYAAEGRSKALGTQPTGGVFTSFTNLQSLGYADEHIWHSGQFRGSQAGRYQYWIKFLDAALIPHLNP